MNNQHLREDRNGVLKRLQKRKKLHQLSLSFVNKEIKEQFYIERAPSTSILISIVFAFQVVLNTIFLIEHAVGENDNMKEQLDQHDNKDTKYDGSCIQTYIYSTAIVVFGVVLLCNFCCRLENQRNHKQPFTGKDNHSNKGIQKSSLQQQQQDQQVQQQPSGKSSSADSNQLNNNNAAENNKEVNTIGIQNNNNSTSMNHMNVSPFPSNGLSQQVEHTISSQNVSNNTSNVSTNNNNNNPTGIAKTQSSSTSPYRSRLLSIYILNQFLHHLHSFLHAYLPILCFILLLSYELTLGISGKFYNFRRADFALIQVFLSVSCLDSWPQKLTLTLVSIALQFKTLSYSLGLIVILPAFLTILYIQERRKKLLFYDYFYLQKTLAAQQKLLDHTLPCSVIVLSSKDEDSQYGSFLRLNSNQSDNNNNNTATNNASIRRNSSQTKKSYLSQLSKQPQMSSVSAFNRQTSIMKVGVNKMKSLSYITYKTTENNNNTNTNNINNNNSNLSNINIGLSKSPKLKKNTVITSNNPTDTVLPDSERSALKETPLSKSTIVPDPVCFNNIVKSTVLELKDLNPNNSNTAEIFPGANRRDTQSIMPANAGLPLSFFNSYVDQQRNEQRQADKISHERNAQQSSSQQQQQQHAEVSQVGEIQLITEFDIPSNNTSKVNNQIIPNTKGPIPTTTDGIPLGFNRNISKPASYIKFSSASMSFQGPLPDISICTCNASKESKESDKNQEKKCTCYQIGNSNCNNISNTIQTPLFLQQQQNTIFPGIFQQKQGIEGKNQEEMKEQESFHKEMQQQLQGNNQTQQQGQQQQSQMQQSSQQQQQQQNIMLSSSQRRDFNGIAGSSLIDCNNNNSNYNNNNTNNNNGNNLNIPYFPSSKCISPFQRPFAPLAPSNLHIEDKNNLSNQLKVNFVNSTCLHSFAIQREETNRRSRPYEGRKLRTEFFNEAQPLQDEVFQLLSQIEVKTSELIDLPFKNNMNNNSQTPLASPFELLDATITQRHNINKTPNKKKLISASLLDVIYQKYSLFHKKYFQQVSKEVNESQHCYQQEDNINDQGGDNTMGQRQQQQQQQKASDSSFEEVCRSLDLEKEDVFVNCVYRSGQAEKMLDIHIIEFQWIDEPAIMVVMTDVSQKVRARRLQDLDSYKNELLATVTHDLKTPLNGMLSILEVALELTDIKEIKNFMTIVQKNGTLLNFLIMDILDYSAMLKGELRLILSRFDINDILKDITDLIGFQAQQKKLKFTIQNNLPEIDCMFDNDSRRVKQILLNLTSNALKFTFSGEIKITLKKEENSNNIVRIIVSDTGVGIPDSLKPKLFKLYGTYDHNNGSNKHGVGLGLVITKKLASQVGPKDTLKLESIEKVGTSFSFQIYKSLKHVFGSSGRGTGVESPGNHWNYNKGESNFNAQIIVGGGQNNSSSYQSKLQGVAQIAKSNNIEINATSNFRCYEDTSQFAKSPVAVVDTLSNNNTQEHFDTDGPFLSQRAIHLHTPTPFFMGGKGQIQKYSQFQQYQSTTATTAAGGGGEGTTNPIDKCADDASESIVMMDGTVNKLSMSKQLDEEGVIGTTSGMDQECRKQGQDKEWKIKDIKNRENDAHIRSNNVAVVVDPGDFHNILNDQSSEIIEIQEPSAYVPRNCQNISNIHSLSQIHITNRKIVINEDENEKEDKDNNNNNQHNHALEYYPSNSERQHSCSLNNSNVNKDSNRGNDRENSYGLGVNHNTSYPSRNYDITANQMQQNDTNSNEESSSSNDNYAGAACDDEDNDYNHDGNIDNIYNNNININHYNNKFLGQPPPLIANTINRYGNSLSFSQKVLNNNISLQVQQQLILKDNDNTNISSILGSQLLGDNTATTHQPLSIPTTILLPLNSNLPLYQTPSINSGNQSIELTINAINNTISSNSNPLRILIVDDTYFNIVALKMLLKQLKHTEVEEAYNGQQALDLLYKYKEQQQIALPEANQLNATQLIFMDINMPIMDGLECTRVIRSDPFFNSAKIVAVTAYSSAAEGLKCFDAGMDAHLCKPISKTDCEAVINSLFQQG